MTNIHIKMTSCAIFQRENPFGLQTGPDIVIPLYSLMAAILHQYTHHWEFKTFNMHLLHNVSAEVTMLKISWGIKSHHVLETESWLNSHGKL